MNAIATNLLVMTWSTRLSAIALLAATSGCGGSGEFRADEGAESGGSSELGTRRKAQDFTVSSCANAQADATYTGGISHESPWDYNTCYKGYVVDINDFSRSGGNGWYKGVNVEYYKSQRLSESQCAATTLRAILYEKVNGEWEMLSDVEKTGSMIQIWDLDQCYLSIIFEDLVSGPDYRIAVTARRDGDTRKVQFENFLYM